MFLDHYLIVCERMRRVTFMRYYISAWSHFIRHNVAIKT